MLSISEAVLQYEAPITLRTVQQQSFLTRHLVAHCFGLVHRMLQSSKSGVMANYSFVELRLDYVEREELADEEVMRAREVNGAKLAHRENRVEWLVCPWLFVDMPLVVAVIPRP